MLTRKLQHTPNFLIYLSVDNVAHFVSIMRLSGQHPRNMESQICGFIGGHVLAQHEKILVFRETLNQPGVSFYREGILNSFNAAFK
jgi:hypothetical protein